MDHTISGQSYQSCITGWEHQHEHGDDQVRQKIPFGHLAFGELMVEPLQNIERFSGSRFFLFGSVFGEYFGVIKIEGGGVCLEACSVFLTTFRAQINRTGSLSIPAYSKLCGTLCTLENRS